MALSMKQGIQEWAKQNFERLTTTNFNWFILEDFVLYAKKKT